MLRTHFRKLTDTASVEETVTSPCERRQTTVASDAAAPVKRVAPYLAQLGQRPECDCSREYGVDPCSFFSSCGCYCFTLQLADRALPALCHPALERRRQQPIIPYQHNDHTMIAMVRMMAQNLAQCEILTDNLHRLKVEECEISPDNVHRLKVDELCVRAAFTSPVPRWEQY
eukprot:g11636.t1